MRENGVRKFVPYRWDDVSCDVNARLYGSLGKEEEGREFFDIEFFEEWEKKERKRKAKGGLHFQVFSIHSFIHVFVSLGEMRGEEKPYQMPVAEGSETVPHQPPMGMAGGSSQPQPQQTKSSNSVQQQRQQQRINNNNLAIQQKLQHLSPIHPQKLSKNKTEPNQQTSTAVIVQHHSLSVPVQQLGLGGPGGTRSSASTANSPAPSAASSSSSSVTPPLSSLTHHPLDSLLTPAASPEEDSLETWIQTVWQPEEWLLSNPT